jgi:tetratricopeptide (TPR) repeat protein
MLKFFISSSKVRSPAVLLAILAIVFVSYLPALRNGFVFWDDDAHLYENVTVRSLDAEHIGDIFRSTVNKIYIPLTVLSFAVEYRFFGYDPFIYHLDNLLLHLAVTALIFWLGLRLRLSILGSGAAALVFGVHPLHVESVAWVTERKDVLYSFFYMAALVSYCCYLNFTRSTPAVQIKKSYRFLVLTVILGVLSMLAKPMALSLPLILLLLDWFQGRKVGREAFIEKIPLLVALAGITLVSYVAHARVPGQGFIEAFLIWSWTLVFYLRQFIFPIILVPVYQLPKPIVFLSPEYFLSVAVVGLLALAMVRFRRSSWFIFSVCFYFFSIFFILRYDEGKDINIVADRFMYLPSVGFCYLLGLWFQSLWEGRRRRLAVTGAAGLMVLAAALSVKTYQQCRIWKDSISLWQHQLKVFSDQPAALNNLAAALRGREEYKNAEETYRTLMKIKSDGLSPNSSDEVTLNIQRVDYVRSLYQRAVLAEPDFIESYYNLGNFLGDIGKTAEAVEAYKKTLSLDYTYKDAHFSLGELYQKAGDDDQAIFAFDQTIALHPKNEDVYVMVVSAYNRALKETPKNILYYQAREKAMDGLTRLIHTGSARATSFFNLGYLYSEIGDLTRAEAAYQMALDINPGHDKALYNLGNVYRDQGRLREALAVYEKAGRANVRNSDVYLNMGTIYERQGNREKAKGYFQKAVKVDPRNARAYFDLGWIEEVSGNILGAVELYQRSIAFDSKNAEAHYNLGNSYARLNKNEQAIDSYLRAVEANPDYMDAWVNLSILSYKAGDFVGAVQYCDRAVLLGYSAPQGYLETLKPYRK